MKLHNSFKINKVFAICSRLYSNPNRTEPNFSLIFSFVFFSHCPNISYFAFFSLTFACFLLSLRVLCFVDWWKLFRRQILHLKFLLNIYVYFGRCLCVHYDLCLLLNRSNASLLLSSSFAVIFLPLTNFYGHFCPVNWSFLCFPFLIDDQPQPNESWLLLAFFDALHNKSCIFSNVAAKMGKKHTQNFVDLWTKKSSSKATRNRKLKIVLAKGFPKLRSKANFSIVFHLFIFGIFFMLFISHEWHNKLGFHWNGERWVFC